MIGSALETTRIRDTFDEFYHTSFCSLAYSSPLLQTDFLHVMENTANNYFRALYPTFSSTWKETGPVLSPSKKIWAQTLIGLT